MPIYAPHETLTALGGDLLPECESRSLFKDRFADPLAKDTNDSTPRKNWFDSLVSSKRRAGRTGATDWLPVNVERLYARLMSRLMVDLAGGVMENANVNLDRYGLPIIPGSAVKGCARRMALQALHDWVAAGTEGPETDDACAPCCEGFKTPPEMLAAIARIFGWVPQDWENGEESDFAWACGRDAGLLDTAKNQLPAYETFAGTIAFLAGSPNCDPGLEIDVVTPHHTKYHDGKEGYETAPDIEDPVPVFFPAVKRQGENDYFTFPLIPLRLAVEGDLDIAKRWLALGLALFGVGAKTNAGYGWFEVEATNKRIGDAVQKAVARTSMEPDADWQEQFKQLNETQRRATINKFALGEEWFPTGGPEAEERIQYSLVHFLLKVEPEFLAADRENHKSKTAKAIAALLSRFPQLNEPS